MTAAFLLSLVKFWLWAGAAVAAVFLTWGIGRIDPNARGAWLFRPLLVPGVLLIWPLVLWRWWSLEAGRENWAARHAPPRTAHQAAAILMAVSIVLALVLGLSARQDWPVNIAPERLTGATP